MKYPRNARGLFDILIPYTNTTVRDGAMYIRWTESRLACILDTSAM